MRKNYNFKQTFHFLSDSASNFFNNGPPARFSAHCAVCQSHVLLNPGEARIRAAGSHFASAIHGIVPFSNDSRRLYSFNDFKKYFTEFCA